MYAYNVGTYSALILPARYMPCTWQCTLEACQQPKTSHGGSKLILSVKDCLTLVDESPLHTFFRNVRNYSFSDPSSQSRRPASSSNREV